MLPTSTASPSASPSPSARLIAPRRSLASCTPAYLARSTLGCAAPGGNFNHYPASPLCSVAWLLHGPTAMVIDGAVSAEMVAPEGAAVFSGPQREPWSTFNPGPTQFYVAIFYPDALHALCGADLSHHVNQCCPAEELLGADWAALATPLRAAADDDQRAALLDAFLEPRWQQVRAGIGSERAVLGDWARHLAVRAASSGWGRGARVVERRIRAWAGLPMRTLQRLGRAEQTLLAARAGHVQGKVSWAGLAQDGGYADQAHLSRETRAITGLSPTELLHAMEHDDSYWMYRIWS